MPISLSIKNVPDEIVSKLRERARKNHRSLQGELLTLLEEAVARASVDVERLSEELRDLKLQTPEESTRLIRELRDGS